MAAAGLGEGLRVTPGQTGGRRPALVVLLVGLLALGGCGVADKKARAEQIIDSVEKAEARATANAELRQSVKLVKIRNEISIPGVREGATSAESSAALALHIPKRQASASVTLPDQTVVPVQLFADTTLFQRRIGEGQNALAALAGQGGETPSASGGRSWLRLEFSGLYDNRERDARNSVGSNLVNPAYMLDLLRGALMGSVKRVGRDEVRGTPTTRYRLNIAPDKAFEDAPKRRQEAMIAGLTLMGVTSDVLPAEVWLDDDGLPRRVKVRFREVRSRRDILELSVTLELFDYGAPVRITLPKSAETAEVDSVGALGPTTAGAQLAPQGAAGGLPPGFGGMPGTGGAGIPAPGGPADASTPTSAPASGGATKP